MKIKEAQMMGDTVEAVEVMPEDVVMTSEMDLPVQEVIVTEELPVVVQDNAPKKFDWKDNKDFGLFMDHIKEQVEKVPTHSGQSSLGCHRAIQYLKSKKKELTDAFGEDFDCKIDEKKAEDLLKDINKKIKGLEGRMKKIHEAYDNDGVYAAESSAFIKEADGPSTDGPTYCKLCGQQVANKKMARMHAELKHPGENVTFSDMPIVARNADDTKMASLDKEAIKPPYARKRGNKWVVLDKHTGKVLSTHDTKEKANGALAAMHMHGSDDGMFEVREVEDNEAMASCDSCNVEMFKSAEDEFCCVSCEKKVKAASLKKEAGTTAFTLMITPFERAIAGMIINGSVSNGKNPEAIYEHVKEKYKLSAREELSIQQVLADMGYPFIKDRGLIGEKDENPLGKGVELATNYWA